MDKPQTKFFPGCCGVEGCVSTHHCGPDGHVTKHRNEIPDGCTCGEFAGTSVKMVDCPVHCPKPKTQMYELEITYTDRMVARYAMTEAEIFANLPSRIESNRTDQNVASWNISPLY